MLAGASELVGLGLVRVQLGDALRDQRGCDARIDVRGQRDDARGRPGLVGAIVPARAELPEYAQKRRARGPHLAALDLERHAEPDSGECGAVDALGAELGEDRAAGERHELGAKASGARDQPRVRDHGSPQAPGRRLIRDAETGIGQRHRRQGEREADGGAAVDPGRDTIARHLGPSGHFLENALLGRVARPLVPRCGPIVRPCEPKHAGVVAGTIAPDRRERDALAGHARRHRRI